MVNDHLIHALDEDKLLFCISRRHALPIRHHWAYICCDRTLISQAVVMRVSIWVKDAHLWGLLLLRIALLLLLLLLMKVKCDEISGRGVIRRHLRVVIRSLLLVLMGLVQGPCVVLIMLLFDEAARAVASLLVQELVDWVLLVSRSIRRWMIKWRQHFCLTARSLWKLVHVDTDRANVRLTLLAEGICIDGQVLSMGEGVLAFASADRRSFLVEAASVVPGRPIQIVQTVHLVLHFPSMKNKIN
jgi:hypothetical protein